MAGRKSGAGFSKRESTGRFGAVGGVIFGLFFAGMGGFFCWMGGVSLILDAMASKSWPQVPCEIVSSEVESHSDSDGTTYSVEITFRYQFEGQYYTGGSYNVSEWNSSGYKSKQKVVDQYLVGSQAVCYVNPNSPEVAVLSSRIPMIAYIVIPFSSIFIIVGLGVMAGSTGILPESWSIAKSRHKRVTQAAGGQMQLKSRSGPAVKLVGIIFFASFWNGIVGVFVWQAIQGIKEGNTDWFLLIFLIPFVAVGLGTIWGIIYYTLALWNPRPSLRLSEGNPALGDTTQLNWEFTGAVQRLSSLTITLEGIESATYRRGTKTVTDRSVFQRATLYETKSIANFRTGNTAITVPVNLMHSFDGGNNKIEWLIKLHGEIRRWPDVKDEFSITVRPHNHS